MWGVGGYYGVAAFDYGVGEDEALTHLVVVVLDVVVGYLGAEFLLDEFVLVGLDDE